MHSRLFAEHVRGFLWEYLPFPKRFENEKFINKLRAFELSESHQMNFPSKNKFQNEILLTFVQTINILSKQCGLEPKKISVYLVFFCCCFWCCVCVLDGQIKSFLHVWPLYTSWDYYNTYTFTIWKIHQLCLVKANKNDPIRNAATKLHALHTQSHTHTKIKYFHQRDEEKRGRGRET